MREQTNSDTLILSRFIYPCNAFNAPESGLWPIVELNFTGSTTVTI